MTSNFTNRFHNPKILNPGTWIFVSMLAACGQLPTETEPKTQSPTLELSEARAGLEVAEFPPESFGMPWSREFKLPEAAELVSFERQLEGSDEWQALGFTNADGVVLDTNVDTKLRSRYRLGGRLVTSWFAALLDMNVEGSFCPTETLVATRVRVAKGSQWITGPCTLSISTREFILDGLLASFDAPGPSRDAGLLRIETQRFSGTGRLRWDGQDGLAGATGAAGVPGKPGRPKKGQADGQNGSDGAPGQSGAAGGAGGEIELVFDEIGFPSSQISVDGGRGGDGGQGGPGGVGGPGTSFEDCHLVGPTTDAEWVCHTRSGKPGRAGSNGAAGSEGAAGKSGTLRLVHRVSGPAV
jgi:hypothetical protein